MYGLYKPGHKDEVNDNPQCVIKSVFQKTDLNANIEWDIFNI